MDQNIIIEPAPLIIDDSSPEGFTRMEMYGSDATMPASESVSGEDVFFPEPTQRVREANTKKYQRSAAMDMTDPAFQALNSIAKMKLAQAGKGSASDPVTTEEGPSPEPPPPVEPSLLDPYEVGTPEWYKGSTPAEGENLISPEAEKAALALSRIHPMGIIRDQIKWRMGLAKEAASYWSDVLGLDRKTNLIGPQNDILDPETGKAIPTGPEATWDDKRKLASVVGPELARTINDLKRDAVIQTTSPIEFAVTGGAVSAKLAGTVGLKVFSAGAVPEFLGTIGAEEVGEHHPVIGFLAEIAAGVTSGLTAERVMNRMSKGAFDLADALSRNIQNIDAKVLDARLSAYNANLAKRNQLAASPIASEVPISQTTAPGVLAPALTPFMEATTKASARRSPLGAASTLTVEGPVKIADDVPVYIEGPDSYSIDIPSLDQPKSNVLEVSADEVRSPAGRRFLEAAETPWSVERHTDLAQRTLTYALQTGDFSHPQAYEVMADFIEQLERNPELVDELFPEAEVAETVTEAIDSVPTSAPERRPSGNTRRLAQKQKGDAQREESARRKAERTEQVEAAKEPVPSVVEPTPAPKLKKKRAKRAKSKATKTSKATKAATEPTEVPTNNSVVVEKATTTGAPEPPTESSLVKATSNPAPTPTEAPTPTTQPKAKTPRQAKVIQDLRTTVENGRTKPKEPFVPATPLTSNIVAKIAYKKAAHAWFGPSIYDHRGITNDHLQAVYEMMDVDNVSLDGLKSKGKVTTEDGKPRIRGTYGDANRQRKATEFIQNYTTQVLKYMQGMVARSTGLKGTELLTATAKEIEKRITDGRMGYNYIDDLFAQASAEYIKRAKAGENVDYNDVLISTDNRLFQEYLEGVMEESSFIRENSMPYDPGLKNWYVKGGAEDDDARFLTPPGSIEAVKGPDGKISYKQRGWDIIDNLVVTSDRGKLVLRYDSTSVDKPVVHKDPVKGIFDFDAIRNAKNKPAVTVQMLRNYWQSINRATKSRIAGTEHWHYEPADQYKYDTFYTASDGTRKPIRRIKPEEVIEAAKFLGWRDDMLQTFNSFNLDDLTPTTAARKLAKNYVLYKDDIIRLLEKRRQIEIDNPSYFDAMDAKVTEYKVRRDTGASGAEVDALKADIPPDYYAMNNAYNAYVNQVTEYIRNHPFTGQSAVAAKSKGRFKGVADALGTVDTPVSNKFFFDHLGRLVVMRNNIMKDIAMHTGTDNEAMAKRMYMYAQDAFGGTNTIAQSNIINRAIARNKGRSIFTQAGDLNGHYDPEKFELSVIRLMENQGLSFDEAERITLGRMTSSSADEMAISKLMDEEGLGRIEAEELYYQTADMEAEKAADVSFQAQRESEAVDDGYRQWAEDAGEDVDRVAYSRAAADEVPDESKTPDFSAAGPAARIEDAFGSALLDQAYAPGVLDGRGRVNLLVVNTTKDLENMLNVFTRPVQRNGIRGTLNSLLPQRNAITDLGVKPSSNIPKDRENQLVTIISDLQNQTAGYAEAFSKNPEDFMAGLAFEKSRLIESMFTSMLTDGAPTPSQMMKLEQLNFSAFKTNDAAGAKQVGEAAIDLFGATFDEATGKLSSSIGYNKTVADMYLSLPTPQQRGSYTAKMNKLENKWKVNELRTDLAKRRQKLSKALKETCGA